MDVGKWLIGEANIACNFRHIKQLLEKRDTTIFVDWSRAILQEVDANVERSLRKKIQRM